MTDVDEAGRNPHGHAVEEWSATYDQPHHLFPGYDGQPHSCPRRIEGTPAHLIEGAGLPDQWTSRPGFGGGEPVGLSCTYCGSLHPGRLLQLLGEGWVIGPTDKGYKAYLHRPESAEEKAANKQRWMDTSAEAKAVRQVCARQQKTAEETAAELEQFHAEVAISPGPTVAKVYFQHVVAVGGVAAFCDLHNTGRMKIGYPGRFYVPPYFTRPEPAIP